MSKFEQITSFISVVEQGSFAAAGRQFGISTAAISRHIAQLEKHLGASLLQRTTRQISLTEIGKRYYDHCKKTIKSLEEAELALSASQEEATGILKVTCNRYFAAKHISPRLPEFMRLNPKLQIQFELAERFPDIVQEGIDILFGIGMEGQSNLVRRRVTTTRYVMCASPQYLEEYGVPEKPADLYEHRYITHSMRRPNNIINFKDGVEVIVEPVLFFNDCIAMRESAIKGLGLAMLHDYMVQDALNNRKLIEVLPAFQEPRFNVYLYYQQSRYLLPKIRKFIDFYLKDMNNQ